MSVLDCYFFGVWAKERLGHHLYQPGGNIASFEALPQELTRYKLDCGPAIDLGSYFLGTKTPFEEYVSKNQIVGVAIKYDIYSDPKSKWSDWTLLTMWDYSGDTRHNSNASFLAKGCHTEAGMWLLAEQYFPEQTKRIRQWAMSKAQLDFISQEIARNEIQKENYLRNKEIIDIK